MFTYISFVGFNKISHGSLESVVIESKQYLSSHKDSQLLIFSDLTGRAIDFDLSGTVKDVEKRLRVYLSKDQSNHVGAGRPSLGVIAREISLLPHHWEWLLNQKSGSSGVIRTLIDEKMKKAPLPKDIIKSAQETTYNFLLAVAGDLPDYEDAIRYLYRKDKEKFEECISTWHKDIRKHAMALSADVFKN